MERDYINQLNKMEDELDQLKDQMTADAEAIRRNAEDRGRVMNEKEIKKFDELMNCALHLEWARNRIAANYLEGK